MSGRKLRSNCAGSNPQVPKDCGEAQPVTTRNDSNMVPLRVAEPAGASWANSGNAPPFRPDSSTDILLRAMMFIYWALHSAYTCATSLQHLIGIHHTPSRARWATTLYLHIFPLPPHHAIRVNSYQGSTPLNSLAVLRHHFLPAEYTVE